MKFWESSKTVGGQKTLRGKEKSWTHWGKPEVIRRYNGFWKGQVILNFGLDENDFGRNLELV